MEFTEKGAALAPDGPGWGGPDDIYDMVKFDGAVGGAYMSLKEAECILELGAVVARFESPYAAMRGLGVLRWSQGPAGAGRAPMHETSFFDRLVGAEDYAYCAPISQSNDRSRSQLLTLESLRQRVEERRAAAAAAESLEYALGFEDDGPTGRMSARFRIVEGEARAVRRAARAARRSGAAHAVVAATAWRHGARYLTLSPAIGIVDGQRDVGFFVAELRVGPDEFWVWACGEEWSGATGRRPVSDLVRRFNLKPL